MCGVFGLLIGTAILILASAAAVVMVDRWTR